MSRPHDYGDQYPSDSGDVSPGDPTDGFVEVDYEIGRGDGVARKAKSGRDFNPKHEVEDQEPEDRDTWSGVIVASLNDKDVWPREYSVLREDGRLVKAETLQLLEYEEYKPGHEVTVHRVLKKDQVPNLADDTFVITGKSRPTESQIKSITLSETSTGGTAPFTVPFDAISLDMPIDALFSDKDYEKIKLKVPGQIELLQADDGIYEIQVQVTVEVEDPLDDLDATHAALLCFKPDQYEYLPDGNIIETPMLWYNKQNGFKIQYDVNDCTGTLEIGSRNVPNSVLNQREVDLPAVWTNSPRFGGHINLGRDMRDAWVKWGQGGSLWLSHGGGELKFRFPGEPAELAGAFLTATGIEGTCVQTGWQNPGASGSVNVLLKEIDYWVHTLVPYCCTLPEGWVNPIGSGENWEDVLLPIVGSSYYIPVPIYYSGAYYTVVSRPVHKDCTITFEKGLAMSGCSLTQPSGLGEAIWNDPAPKHDDLCEYMTDES